MKYLCRAGSAETGKLVSLTMVALILVSCVYDVPLDKVGAVPLDSKAIGAWKGANGTNLEISTKENSYVAVLFPGTDQEIEYRAFPTRISNQIFLNIQVVQSKSSVLLLNRKKKYFFATYKVAGNKLIIRLLSERLISADTKSSTKLRETITRHINDEKLFESGKPLIFTKSKAQ